MDYNETDLMNRDQSEAVKHLTGPCLVIAPPGSGKTYVLVSRIRYLTDTYHVKPESLLVISFTRAAAGEMKERYLKAENLSSTEITFGTFHSAFLNILKVSFGFNSGIITDNSAKRYLEVILRDMYRYEEDYPNEELLLSEISRVKNKGDGDLSSVYFDKDSFAEIFRRYNSLLRSKGSLDFDDIILRCYEELKSHPDILSKWQEKYEYILVDEFQDINRPQYEVLKLLAGEKKNLFMVGDDDQSIYGFRGSDPKIMINLSNDYPFLRKIYLNTNYRSFENIIFASKNLIGNNSGRYDKAVVSDMKTGGVLEFNTFEEASLEYAYIASEIKKSMTYGNTGIITRTAIVIPVIATYLAREGIPFFYREKIKSPFDSFALKDLLSYIKLADNMGDMSDLLRILNKPCRYISRTFLDIGDTVTGAFSKLREAYKMKPSVLSGIIRLEKDISRIRGFNLFAAINYILKGIGYEEYLRKEKAEDEEVFQVLESIIKLIQAEGKDRKGYRAFLEIIEKRENELEKEKGDMKEDAVTISTMHASKGLEYDNVYIPDVNEKNIPHRKAFLAEDIEEERRVFYVGITRARKKVCLSAVYKKGDRHHEVSRFIKELKL